MAKQSNIKDKIRGSLIGGAIGDALGYPVEFLIRQEIINKYGVGGIERFELNDNGIAEISDDTQMTLFTANALLYAVTHLAMKGIAGDVNAYICTAYDEWLQTQKGIKSKVYNNQCWISTLAGLYSRRAPGNTCLQSLLALEKRKEVTNNSKGCGGVMRVAPVGLYKMIGTTEKQVIDIACESAWITHKHPMGFLPAGVLAYVIRCIITSETTTVSADFEDYVYKACELMKGVQCGDEYADELKELLSKAICLAKSEGTDADAIRQLGEGWTGDEALAIAVYCVVRHFDSFEDAVVAAVNHDGDSDSTGAICGNIMGAIHGFDAIPDYYKTNLELADVILALADDLCCGCCVGEYNDNDSPEQQQWMARYVYCYPYGFPNLKMQDIKLYYKIPPLYWIDAERGPNADYYLKKDIPKFYFLKSRKISFLGQELHIWFPCEFSVEGTQYHSVGQYIQAEKARVFGDLEKRKAILAACGKHEILRLGRSVSGYGEKRWKSVAYAVAVYGNYHKFIQDAYCKKVLTDSEGLILVNDDADDLFWGVGYERSEVLISNPEKWRGRNLMGFALMEVREILIKNKYSCTEFSEMIFLPEDNARMKALPTVKERIDYKSKLIHEGKYKLRIFKKTQSGIFTIENNMIIGFEPAMDNIIRKDDERIVLSNLVFPPYLDDDDEETKITNGIFNNIEVTGDVRLPNTLTEIGDYAFVRCSLPKVYIPQSVRKIGEFAFGECRIETLKIYSESLKAKYGRQFKDSIIDNLYIPDGSVKKLREMKNWNVLHSIRCNAEVKDLYLDHYAHLNFKCF